MEAEIAMLARRTNLLNDRAAAMKAFTKASTKAGGSGQQHKLEDLRRVKEEKENELERCSKTGKAEIRRFHQRRLTEMRDALVHYAEGQISSAKDACEELSKGLGRIRDFQVPQQGSQSTARTASSLAGDEASWSQKSGE